MQRCSSCKRSMCNKCRKQLYECKQCIIKSEQRTIFKAIKQSNIDIKSHNIIKIITQYAIGYIFKCLNDECSNIITIDNKYQFLTSLNIKHYRIYKGFVNNKNKDKCIKLYGKYRQIGCGKCDMGGCSYACANFYFANSKIAECLTHRRCDFCDGSVWASYGKPANWSQCKYCKHCYCSKCGLLGDDLCKECEINHLLKLFHKSIYSQIGKLLGDETVHIIASYSIGYILKCCNESCGIPIHINNRIEFENNIDSEGRQIYQYTIRNKCVTNKEKRKQNFIFGKYRRYFCSQCVSGELLDECIIDFGTCNNKVISGNTMCVDHMRCDECGRSESAWYCFCICCEFCNKYLCEYCKYPDMMHGNDWIPTIKNVRKCQYIMGTYEYALGFTNNSELIALSVDYNEDRYWKCRSLKKSRNRKIERKHRWRTYKKGKIKSYIKRKKDKCSNHKSKRRFNKKYLLMLQY